MKILSPILISLFVFLIVQIGYYISGKHKKDYHHPMIPILYGAFWSFFITLLYLGTII